MILGKVVLLACGFSLHLKGGSRSEVYIHTPLFVSETTQNDS